MLLRADYRLSAVTRAIKIYRRIDIESAQKNIVFRVRVKDIMAVNILRAN